MKASVWYHTRLFGGQPEINPDYSITLMTEQMATLKRSGLLEHVQELVVCINGDAHNQVAARGLAPKGARFIDNGADALGLLRTCNHLRDWSLSHRDWLVCFWHIKGVTHPWDVLNTLWRRCMEKCVIEHWQRCVTDMEKGYDSVGAHWLTPEHYHGIVKLPFWGGQFFWVRAGFLADLPALPNNPSRRDEWFLSENWIGMGRRPRVKDYAPHWPGVQPCAATQ